MTDDPRYRTPNHNTVLPSPTLTPGHRLLAIIASTFHYLELHSDDVPAVLIATITRPVLYRKAATPSYSTHVN